MAPRRIDLDALPAESLLARRIAARRPGAVEVGIEHDGDRIRAREGENLALALVASGRATLARSTKYHRPRGPSCLRGVCDGCLVRVDGVPNVMACRVPVREGMRVHSQNAFPTAAMDLLRMTDWFFPRHMDHHHLMVRLGGAANRTMQSFARRMAGLGTLPDEEGSVPDAGTPSVDVLVVGAGPSGVAAANELSRRGLAVLCVDEEPAPGGAGRDAIDAGATPLALDPGVTFLPEASAVATYDNGTLVLERARVSLVTARARVFANGCHETLGCFAQNDLPGVYTARAFARALVAGVLLGEVVALVGDGRWARGIAEALPALGVGVEWLREGTLVAARGGRSVRGATVALPAGERRVRCDVLVVEGGAVAAYELAGQAGAHVGWDDARRCFAPASDATGATAAPGVYVTGSLRGGGADRVPSEIDGARVAGRVAADLATGG